MLQFESKTFPRLSDLGYQDQQPKRLSHFFFHFFHFFF